MKFLIVGAGMIGQVHAQALKDLGQDFVFCDAFQKNVDNSSDIFGIQERYADYEEAIKQSGADAVIVCTPNHLHAPVAICAMENGLDVLCEKPMAATSQQARAMMDAVRRTGRKMMIGYIIRSGDALYRAKEILSDGSLGKVLSARCVLAAPETLEVAKTPYRRSYETGGGIIYDYTHEVDYLRFLLGDPIEGFCYCESLLKQEDTVDDSVDALLKFEGGITAHLHLDYLQERGRGRGRYFDIVCEKGFLSCDFSKLHVYYNDGTDIDEVYTTDWNAPFPRQLRSFMRYLKGETVPCALAEDGLRVMEIADALYESAQKREIVKF